MQKWMTGSMLILVLFFSVPMNHGQEKPLDAAKRYDPAIPPQPSISHPPPSQIKKVKRRICAQVFYLEAKSFEEVEKRLNVC